jgi:aldose 1-epimerase
VQNGTAYFGGLIGRVANRIARARFTLDGKAYRLFPNDGNNTLHGTCRGNLFSFPPYARGPATLRAVIGSHLSSYCCPGGHRGFSKVVWTVKEHVGGGSSPSITLYYHSFDGEQGRIFEESYNSLSFHLLLQFSGMNRGCLSIFFSVTSAWQVDV